MCLITVSRPIRNASGRCDSSSPAGRALSSSQHVQHGIQKPASQERTELGRYVCKRLVRNSPMERPTNCPWV
eukprot:3386477-Heterocapsa_arctica.AAC.1